MATGRTCFYQTPAMRTAKIDYALPGIAVPQGTEAYAIEVPQTDGRFLRILPDGSDGLSNDPVPRDQEILLCPVHTSNQVALVADRTMYEPYRAYFVSVVFFD